MKTIAYLIDTMSCDTAGTQKQLLETIRRLDRTRFAPHLICLWESPWMHTAQLPCPVHVLGHAGFLKPSFPGVVRRLGGLIDELGISLLQTFFDEAIFVGWLGARRARRRPVLLSSRRDMGLGASNQPWYHRLFPVALPLVNRDFAAIVANSDMVRRYAARRERTPVGKFVVLRNGVEVPLPQPPPAAWVADGRVGVGIVASLTPVKRHDLLLRAWAVLESGKAAGSARLFVLGDGPGSEALQGLAGELGLKECVNFVGAVDNVPAWLQRLDVGVLCSDREGLSNAILEYMACGLPVVATATGGNAELVDADNGLLVPPGDEQALAAALERLILDGGLRRALGEASRRRIDDSFTWDRAMGDLMACYDDVLSGLANHLRGA